MIKKIASFLGMKGSKERSGEIRYLLTNRDLDDKTKIKMEKRFLSIGDVDDILEYISKNKSSMRNKFENFIIDQDIDNCYDALRLMQIINNTHTLNKAQLEVRLIQSKCIYIIVEHLTIGNVFDESSLTKIVLEEGSDRDIWDTLVSEKELKDEILLINKLKELNEFAYQVLMLEKNKNEFFRSKFEEKLIIFCKKNPSEIDNDFLIDLLNIDILDSRDFFESLLLSSNDISMIIDYYIHSELVSDRSKFELQIYHINNSLSETLRNSVVTITSLILDQEKYNVDLIKESEAGRDIIAADKGIHAILDMYHNERKYQQYPRHLREKTHIADFTIENKDILEGSFLNLINSFGDDFFPVHTLSGKTFRSKSDELISLLTIKDGLDNRVPFLEILHSICKRDRQLTIGDWRGGPREELRKELSSRYGAELYRPLLRPYN